MGFAHYQGQHSFFDFQIALVVTKAVDVARPGDIFVCEIAEAKAAFDEFAAMHHGLTAWVELSENTPVFAQNIIDIAHEIARIAVKTIIVTATALYGAILLIRPADKGLAALLTFSIHHRRIKKMFKV